MIAHRVFFANLPVPAYEVRVTGEIIVPFCSILIRVFEVTGHRVTFQVACSPPVPFHPV